MNRRLTVIALIAILVAPFSVAAQSPVVESMKGLYDTTEEYITATAHMLNEEMYAFRPTEEVRSTGQILAHIANAQFAFCAGAAGEASPNTENFEETPTTKPRILEALQDGFAYCDRVFANTTDASGMNTAMLFGGSNTVFGILAFNSAHNFEHYGNLVTYMRLNGITPPSSM